jgi:intracellular sulfur oxidation DsrE/DsrF family protein
MGKQFAAVGVLLLTLLLSHQAESAGTGEAVETNRSHRVVIHMNSGDERVQYKALNNIRNLYQEVGRERLQLELVAHGDGLSLLTKAMTPFGGELARLKADFGVHFTACSNTMKAAKLTRDDLIAEVEDTVPAMVRLMERQEQGWAYIKP